MRHPPDGSENKVFLSIKESILSKPCLSWGLVEYNYLIIKVKRHTIVIDGLIYINIHELIHETILSIVGNGQLLV